MVSESNTFLPYLTVLGLAIITIAIIFFWRNCALFNQQNQLSSVASCALLWGGIGLIVGLISMGFTGAYTHLFTAFKTGFIESIRIGMLGMDDAIFIVATPLFALFGAIFGAIFAMLDAFNKASASVLQRGFIGLLIGIITTLLITALIVFVVVSRGYIKLDEIINQEYGVFIIIIYSVVLGSITLTCLVLSLLTPRHLLTKKVFG
jgi:hypothetical protein